MNPEQYTRGPERGRGQTPSAAPPPFGTDSGSPFDGRFRGVAKLASTPPGRLILAGVVTSALAVAWFIANYSDHTTVHGNLIMLNSGATATIACNDGNLKLDGDNNTYTVTGHCRRLEVFGSANRVTVDSAVTISVFGDDNAMTYHAGSPTINKTGNNNIVAQRPSTRR